MIRRGHTGYIPGGCAYFMDSRKRARSTICPVIRELDISRQTIIVMVKRNGTMLVPKGDLTLLEGDRIVLYSQERISGANTIQI